MICSSLSAYQANGSEYTKVPYKASYSYKSPQGSQTMKIVNDGKGKMRTDTMAPSGTVISIVDYKNDTAISLIQAQKLAVKTKMKQTPSVTDEKSAKAHGAKSIGKKKILKRDCQGWEYTVPTGKSTVWVDKTSGCAFESITKTPQGEYVMKITEFSPVAPAESMFNIPAGYKVMNSPSM